MNPGPGRPAALVGQPRRGGSLTDDLVERLGVDIVAGRFGDGAAATEGAIATRFSVSRSVVREAAKILASKGLLGARPRQGTSVLPPERWSWFDPDVIRWLSDRRRPHDGDTSLLELRLALEPAAARFAALRRDGREIQRVIDRSCDAPGPGDRIDLHLAILSASGNPFLARMGSLVRAAIVSAQITVPVDVDDWRAIAEAIGCGDGRQAEALVHRLVVREAAEGQKRREI